MSVIFLLLALITVGCSDNGKSIENGASDGSELTVANVDLTPKKGTGRWYTTSQLEEGNKIYSENCASCHGKAAASVEEWRKPDSNGNYPPPPLNGRAHAWHHPLSIMDKVISEGGEPLGGVMPAWGSVLSEGQRLKAVASFQQYWDDETYDRWMEREESSRE
jgi:mono/diheme cytochrome c family protein